MAKPGGDLLLHRAAQSPHPRRLSRPRPPRQPPIRLRRPLQPARPALRLEIHQNRPPPTPETTRITPDELTGLTTSSQVASLCVEESVVRRRAQAPP